MRPAHPAVGAGLALLVLLGCSERSERRTPPLAAATKPEPAKTPEVPAPVEPPAPAELPVAATPDPARGAIHYAALCASCHGPKGDGDGPIAASLDPKPARHADGAYMNALSDEHLFLVIKKGGPAVGKSVLMAPWADTLDDDQIRDVIAYIRSLAEPPYEP